MQSSCRCTVSGMLRQRKKWGPFSQVAQGFKLSSWGPTKLQSSAIFAVLSLSRCNLMQDASLLAQDGIQKMFLSLPYSVPKEGGMLSSSQVPALWQGGEGVMGQQDCGVSFECLLIRQQLPFISLSSFSFSSPPPPPFQDGSRKKRGSSCHECQ